MEWNQHGVSSVIRSNPNAPKAGTHLARVASGGGMSVSASPGSSASDAVALGASGAPQLVFNFPFIKDLL